MAKAIDYPEIIAGKEIYGKPLEYWRERAILEVVCDFTSRTYQKMIPQI